MILHMFFTCIGMLKSLHKTQNASIELLTDQDYDKLRELALSKAEDIIKLIFKD